MPDEDDKDLTDEEEVPESPLHAHNDRDDQVVGDEEPAVGEEGDLDDPEAEEQSNPPGNPVGEEN